MDLSKVLEDLPSLTYLVLRVDTLDCPLTGVDPITFPATHPQQRLLDEFAHNNVAAVLFYRMPSLRFLAIYTHGCAPRFWRGLVPIGVEEGEEVLRVQGTEWREVPRMASPEEPDEEEMEDAFA